jgi:hypothetical protein
MRGLLKVVAFFVAALISLFFNLAAAFACDCGNRSSWGGFVALALIFFAFLALIVHLIDERIEAALACGLLLIASPIVMTLSYPPAN